MKRQICSMLAVLLIFSMFIGCAQSQAPASSGAPAPAESKFPKGTIEIISPTGAGGFADISARLVAAYLQKVTGQPVVVVNMEQASGAVGYDTVMRAEPNGNTMMIYHRNFALACYTGIFEADPDEDFTTVAALMIDSPPAVVVGADSKYQTIQDLVDDGKARPGEIIYGGTRGNASHFISALIEKDTGITFKFVEGGKESERIASILGGHLDICNMGIASAAENVEAGKLRILGIACAQRDPQHAEYPTFAEQGYPNVIWAAEMGLYGPAGMDPEVVKAINEALKDFGSDPDVIAGLTTLGTTYTYRNVEESQKILSEIHQTCYDMSKELGLLVE